MERIRFERNNDQRLAARIVLAVKIAFEYQPPIANNDDAVKIPYSLLGDGLVEPFLHIIRKPGFSRRYAAPTEHAADLARIDSPAGILPVAAYGRPNVGSFISSPH